MGVEASVPRGQQQSPQGGMQSDPYSRRRKIKAAVIPPD